MSDPMKEGRRSVGVQDRHRQFISTSSELGGLVSDLGQLDEH